MCIYIYICIYVQSYTYILYSLHFGIFIYHISISDAAASEVARDEPHEKHILIVVMMYNITIMYGFIVSILTIIYIYIYIYISRDLRRGLVS